MKNRILIVDDEILVNRFLENRLVRENFAVEIAIDGQEALEKARHKKYDLILTDLMIPNVAGLELIAQIRKTKLNPETPIIVLSSLSSDELIVSVLATGVKDYIVRPFSINVVVAKIKQLIQESKSEAA